MLTFHQAQQLRQYKARIKRKGQTIALVPTMGNLHAGHLKLIAAARERADCVVVSIFINPTQFTPDEDYQNYPRTLNIDQAMLKKAHVNALFQPTVQDLYAMGTRGHSIVEVPALSHMLCGLSRKGHFRGVATVVNKLFNLLMPDYALFGKKDYQQLQVINAMVCDLFLPIKIIGIETHRENDGLAMSSRNQYLNTLQRRTAPLLYRSLLDIEQHIRQGQRDYTLLCSNTSRALIQAGFEPDYVSICCQNTLIPADENTKELVILAAAQLGSARLIDNLELLLST